MKEIKTIEYININNSKQCISIITENETNPLLLYLHGGPGDAALPLVAKYNQDLESIFTVVILEQRGAGKSYYPFSKDETINIDCFLADIYELSVRLLKRFGKEKLYLIGHSWGSVLGLKFIQLYPHLVYAYIGCGQVVNMQKSSKMAYEYALQKSEEIGDKKTVEHLKLIDYTYHSKRWLDELLFVTKQVVKQKGSLYGKTNYNSFVLDFLLSPDYGIRDLINREKGSLQSIRYLWQELMDVNFENVTQFKVPVIFMEGRHDYHVSSALVHTYFDSLKSEKRFYWFEKSCHFPHWSEPDKFFDIMKHDVKGAGYE